MSLTLSAARRAEPAISTCAPGPPTRCQPGGERLADLQRPWPAAPATSRHRRAVTRSRPARSSTLGLELRAEPANRAQALGLRRPRAAPAASRCPARECSSRARLGPRPGRRVIAIRPAGNCARSFSAAGIVPVSSKAWIFSCSVLPIPGSSYGATLARERRHRHGRVAHGLGAAAVGEHAVDDRAVELVQVAELLERFGDRVVGQLASGPLHQRTDPWMPIARRPKRAASTRSRVRRPMSGEPWLILPTYNEAENVQAIVSAAGEVLRGRRRARWLSRARRR